MNGVENLYWIFQRILERILGLVSEDYGEVLMCHEVSNNIDNWYDEAYSVKASSMIAFIRELQDCGYKFDSIDNIDKKERNRIFLTFDDGFESVYREIYPFLKENRIPFCVFVTTDCINKPHYLTLDMVREISNSGIGIIGAHTLTHPNLRELTPKEARKEIAGSKSKIEKMIKKKVEYFAYPYGCLSRCSYRNIRQVKRSRYKLGFSTLDAKVNKYLKYFIPRRNISETSLVHIKKQLLAKGENNA